MNGAIRETRECSYGKWVRTTWVKKHQCRFTTGSTAYTKPLFRLVKCMILALPWSLNECPDVVSDESFDHSLVVLEFFKFFRVWRVMNSKRCYSGSVVIGRVFSQMKVMRELRETSAEILGSLMNGKSRPKPGSNLRHRRLLAHILIFSVSNRTADWQGGSLMWELHLI